MVPDGRESILIIEDDESIRATMRMLFEIEGYEVVEAVNGLEGLDRLSHSPHPCLILLDMMMPVMNGCEFDKAIDDVPACGDIPIVAVTAFPEKTKALKHVRGTLQKPFEMDQLLDIVRRYCPGC